MARSKKKRANYALGKETPLNYSGNNGNIQSLPKLRQGYFYKEEIDIGGDAPKDFLRIYQYGNGRKDKPRHWVGYIAKVGHKWYPVESITEYIMNRIGEVIIKRCIKLRMYRLEEIISH